MTRVSVVNVRVRENPREHLCAKKSVSQGKRGHGTVWRIMRRYRRKTGEGLELGGSSLSELDQKIDITGQRGKDSRDMKKREVGVGKILGVAHII